MFIAQELRKTNIAEYLLYMWQVEDTIRAFGYSLSRIRKEYIERFDYNDEQKEELTDWYGNLIRMMNQENCRDQGHLQINKVTLQTLCELHAQLLASSKFPFYNAEYYRVLPYIVELRSRGADKRWRPVSTHSTAPCCYACRRRRLPRIRNMRSRKSQPSSACCQTTIKKTRRLRWR